MTDATEIPPATPDVSTDPSTPPGTTIDQPGGDTNGDGKIHKVLSSELADYLSGNRTTVTAVCGIVWAPRTDSNYDGSQETCAWCYPVYTHAS